MAGTRQRSTDSEEGDPVLLDLRLADGSPAEAFERVARAIDSGTLSIQHGKMAADILERRLRIVDAERFRQRLATAEAMALEAVRRSPALPVPASRATVDVDASASQEAS